MKRTFLEYLNADKANKLFLGLWIFLMALGISAWVSEPKYGFYLWLFWFLVGLVYTLARYNQYKKLNQ